jgi:outer membrane murein-binding lipoprotein Lpp
MIQKSVIAATLAVATTAGIYEASQASRFRSEAQTLRQQQAPLSEQVQRLQSEADDAKSQLAALQAQNGQSDSNQDTRELLKLRGEVAQLRQQLAENSTPSTDAGEALKQSLMVLVRKAEELNQRLEQMPEKKIPEIHFLSAEDWLNVAKDAKFDTETDLRKSFSRLRGDAKNKMPMGWALSGYIRAHNGQLPTELSQLKPYFKTPVNDGSTSHWHGVDPTRDDVILDAIISRYTLLHTGNISDLDANAWLVVEKAPVDKDYDSRVKFRSGVSTIIDTSIGKDRDPDDKTY